MSKLKIEDLYVSVNDKEILKGLSIEFSSNETIALLGPNGNGKSTLLQTIMGNPNYTIKSGNIWFDDKDITKLSVDERSKLGLFLGMQYPSEVPGVNNSDFLKSALNTHREKPVSLFEFYKILDNAYKQVHIPFEMSTRNLNEGFSGGEKKKNEILQMLLLNPKFAIQTVANVIKEEQLKRGFLIVSHYAKLYDLIHIDKAIVLINGRVAKVGDKSLIKKIDENGYEWLKAEGIEFKDDTKMNSVSIGTCATKEALKGAKWVTQKSH